MGDTHNVTTCLSAGAIKAAWSQQLTADAQTVITFQFFFIFLIKSVIFLPCCTLLPKTFYS